MDSDHKTFEDLLKDVFDEETPNLLAELSDTSIPLDDTHSQLLLMHRDTHFGGSFSAMAQYYEQDGIGALADFYPEDIERLAALEAASGQDLANLLFSETCLEIVDKARKAYEALRNVYEDDVPADNPARLISDLILSEEEEPEKEIQAILDKGSVMIPLLLRIVEEPDFHDALSPGYGYAPMRAVDCLGRLRSSEAIVPLFEALSRSSYALENDIQLALATIGKPAKEFLLQVMQQEPVTKDNAQALTALIEFCPDIDIARACLASLQGRPKLPGDQMITLLLILGCEGLESQTDRAAFRILIEGMDLPDTFRDDITLLLRRWEQDS